MIREDRADYDTVSKKRPHFSDSTQQRCISCPLILGGPAHLPAVMSTTWQPPGSPGRGHEAEAFCGMLVQSRPAQSNNGQKT